MKEWNNTNIKLDNYTTIELEVLITEKSSYDMLFGLNACSKVNGVVDIATLFLRYAFKDDK